MDKDKKKKMINTYTKRLVTIVIAVSLIDIQLSYVLAFFGKDSLEGISTQLIITVLGTSIVYMIRAFFDSWAEHKNDINNIEVPDSNDDIVGDL